METSKIFKILFALFAAVLCFSSVGLAEPIGTAFTYQGRLIDANNAADGLYDFQFKLFDGEADSNQLGLDVNVLEVDVIDGYFTVELDFGSVFDGNERWLDIGVRPGDLNDPNLYTILSPRQEVTATPYAQYAMSAGVVSMPIMLSGSGTVPVISGTSTGNGLAVYGLHDASGNEGYLGGSSYGVYGKSTSGHAGYFDGDTAITGDLAVDGSVGVGTSSPTTALDVNGTVKATAFVGDGSGLTGVAGTRSATIVVAASNSGNPDSADYICDGVADDETINAALAALPAVGGSVLCREGDYTFQGSVTIPDDNTMLEFTIGNTVRIVADGNTLTYYERPDKVWYLIGAFGKNNVRIKGVTMDWEAGAADQTKFPVPADSTHSYAGIWLDNCSDSIIEDCNVKNVVFNGFSTGGSTGIWGILVSDCNNFRILNCSASKAGYEGIGVRAGCETGEVRGCYMTGNYAHGVQIASWSPTLDYTSASTNIIIADCVTSNKGGGYNDIIIHGLYGAGTGGNKIINNKCTTISCRGDVNGTLIEGNKVGFDEDLGTTYKTVGIFINSIDGWEGRDCLNQNINIRNNEIIRTDGSAYGGIIIEASKCSTDANVGGIKRCLVEGNILQNRKITLYCSDNGNVIDTVVRGNIIRNNNTTTANGIYLNLEASMAGSIRNVAITDNFIKQVQDTRASSLNGIYIGTETGATGEVNGIYIRDNIIDAEGFALATTTGTGGNIYNLFFERNTVQAGWSSTGIANNLFYIARNTTGPMYVNDNVVYDCNRIFYTAISKTLTTLYFERNNVIGCQNVFKSTTLTINNLIMRNNIGSAIVVDNIIDKTADYTILAEQTAMTFSNSGATGIMQFSFPAAKAGMRYTAADVVNTAAADVNFAPDGTDYFVLEGVAMAAGEKLLSDEDVLSGIEVYCFSDGVLTVIKHWGDVDKETP